MLSTIQSSMDFTNEALFHFDHFKMDGYTLNTELMPAKESFKG